MDDKDYPVIKLPGSDEWESSWENSKLLEERFPGQDGYDFLTALTYNPIQDISGMGIVGLLLLQRGENDGRNWVWVVQLVDGNTYLAEGGCDYTGWDCQSSLHAELIHTVDGQYYD